jgi:hydroxypyruvate isomerase
MDRRAFLATAASATARLRAQAPPPPPAAKVISSVVLWTLPGDSFAAKLELVARTGIQSVELLDEHASWTEPDVDRARRTLRSFDVGVDLISAVSNASPLDPAQRSGFLAEVSRQIAVAHRLEAPMLHVTAGLRLAVRSAEDQWASLVESLQRAANLAAKANLTLLIEPRNSKVDHRGSFLESAVAGVRLMKQVNHERVRLLYDLYHEHVQTGDAVGALEAAAPWVKVFHVADSPGRGEPGTGTIPFDAAYKAIRKLNFEGPVAMEYKPVGSASASLIRAVDAMRASMVAAPV